ncbi:MAG: chemotaxis protein CheA [Tabrizicola sp.]|uniref:chemotaxis protein CheA n=1 Tax=Tabrizicola sp. TaxID=2005166 RepID=UPI002AB950E1|nr:chemotaxis protein CheA [Tabrizicola sp.]MDZ4085931.1 chemotaxis protein CheA [Tabrizicola sp.]
MSVEDDVGSSIYRQEAGELVQSIEAGLIALERAPDDRDLLNALFRDLHTVKGSGAMFGFTELAMFVHEFETAFDKLRRGEAAVTASLIAISLQACDQIMRLLDAPQTAAPESAAILSRLRVCLEGADDALETDTCHSDPEEDPDLASSGETEVRPGLGLRVTFRLASDALMHGHDPDLLLDDLRSLGPCRVRALVDEVPPLDQLDPTECLLGWDVEIAGTVDPSDVDSAFLFTRDSMMLTMSPLESGPVAAAQPQTETSLPSGLMPVSAAAISAPVPGSTGTAPSSTEPPRQTRAAGAGDTMRVSTERLDELMDRVGELVIAEARLQSLAQASRDSNLLAVAEDIQRLSAALRDSTMSIRMMPLSSILGRFQRLIRDLSASLGKPMTFVTRGEETALDKTVLELLADPLVHLLRNCADHGLEPPEERIAFGKAAAGTIELTAEYSGAEVLITIRDDGRGLDATRIRSRAIERGLIAATSDLPEAELFRLIFEPGFSTAPTVTELSGRGVGMDVVKRTISGLRGTIDLTSEPGHGTTVRLRLPLTLAIIDGLLVEVGGEHYTVPLASVEECVELPEDLATPRGGSSFVNIRGNLVPFLRLRTLFSVGSPLPEFQKLVVVSSAAGRVGLAVDRIVANNQTVIKQLSPLHTGLKSFSGATILGDGTVALILDVAQLVGLGRTLEEQGRKNKTLQERAA